MIDPRDVPAFWGLCGGLLSGAVGLVTAYSAKPGNPVAQRRAWLHLELGIVAGPVVAEALTEGVILAVVPSSTCAAWPCRWGGWSPMIRAPCSIP